MILLCQVYYCRRNLHRVDDSTPPFCYGCAALTTNCTRTYESLVGEYKGKGQTYLMGKQTDNSIRCICQTWTGRADWVEGHHPNCDGWGNHIPLPPKSAKYEQVAGMQTSEDLNPDIKITYPPMVEGQTGWEIHSVPSNSNPTAVGVDEPELSLNRRKGDKYERLRGIIKQLEQEIEALAQV